jgi:striatin 1/3/4
MYIYITIMIIILYHFLINLCRARYHKLKYGTDLIMQGDVKPPLYEEGTTCNVSEGGGGGGGSGGSSSGGGGGGGGGDGEASSISNVTWRQGRQLLRQYVKYLL